MNLAVAERNEVARVTAYRFMRVVAGAGAKPGAADFVDGQPADILPGGRPWRECRVSGSEAGPGSAGGRG